MEVEDVTCHPFSGNAGETSRQRRLRTRNPNNTSLSAISARESSCSTNFISKIKNKDAVHLSRTCCLLIILRPRRLLLSFPAAGKRSRPGRRDTGSILGGIRGIWWPYGGLTRSVVGVTMETAETETNEAVLLCRNRLVLNRYATPTTFFGLSYLVRWKKVKQIWVEAHSPASRGEASRTDSRLSKFGGESLWRR